MSDMTADNSAALLAAFPPEQIGTLPRGGIQISYVGHADVTRRLCEVDPEWTWKPFACNELGDPVVDVDESGKPVGLWIYLTVCGVSRPGYGSCPPNQSDAIKVLIGDALRNASMRFGVAVDLWAKGDRAAPDMENAQGPAGDAVRRNGPKANDGDARNRILALGKDKNVNVVEDFRNRYEASFGQATPDQLREYEALLKDGVVAP